MDYEPFEGATPKPLPGRQAETYHALMKGLLARGLRNRDVANRVWEALRLSAEDYLPRRVGATSEDLRRQAEASEAEIQAFWKEKRDG